MIVQIDELGRVTIPKNIREILEIKKDDEIKIRVNRDIIELKKYVEKANFCQMCAYNKYELDDIPCCNCCHNYTDKFKESETI